MKRKNLFIKLNFITLFAYTLFSNLPKTAFAATVTTGLGDIDATPEGIATWVKDKSLWVASGISFLLILMGGIKLIAAKGDPKAIDEARKTITSALVGLLVIYLAVMILKTIGGPTLLNIPGWGTFFN